jgi:hypothetical protein
MKFEKCLDLVIIWASVPSQQLLELVHWMVLVHQMATLQYKILSGNDSEPLNSKADRWEQSLCIFVTRKQRRQITCKNNPHYHCDESP